MSVSLEEKQKYLKSQLAQPQQEQFFQFLMEQVFQGNETNLNQTYHRQTLQYVQNLVHRYRQYKEKQEKQANHGNRDYSIVQYQTGKDYVHPEPQYQDPNANTILPKQLKSPQSSPQTFRKGNAPIINNQKNQKQKVSTEGTVQEPKGAQYGSTNKKIVLQFDNKTSAIDLLDSFFDNSSNLTEQKLPPPDFDLDMFWSNGLAKPSKPQKTNINQADFLSNRIPTQNNTKGVFKQAKTQSMNKEEKKLHQSQQIATAFQKKKFEQQNHSLSTSDLHKVRPSSNKTKKMKKVPYKGNKVHKSEFKDQISCHKAGKRKGLDFKDLSVIIEKHQVVERSFFMSNYVMYHMRVKPLNIVLKRNYQDFSKLRSLLQKFYPGAQLPYLQKNDWFETSIQNVKKQKTMLQFFLRDLFKNKQIKNSAILQDFLTLPEHKAIKRKFQTLSKLDKLNGIEDLILIDGKVEVSINEQNRIYSQYLSPYVYKMEGLMDNFRRLHQYLANLYVSIENTLTDISSLANDIAQQTEQFNAHVQINEIKGFSETFKYISSIYEQSKARNHFQIQVINRKILPFTKYQKENIGTIREIISTRDKLYRDYMKRSQTQNTGANLTYVSQKLKYYKDGVQSQSKNILVLKYQTGYFCNKLCAEADRMFQQVGISFCQKFSYISDKHLKEISKASTFWSKQKMNFQQRISEYE